MTFLWGAATSSHQVEGGNRHNDWWHWESLGKTETGERSGPAADHWNRFKEDLALAKQMGLNSYRFSIEWSRLEPEDGKWDLSALDWYEALIEECERLDLMPMATLHHFTSPQWFSASGAFTREDSAERFSAYVRKVVERLGSRVPMWCTLNEPNTLVIGQYLGSYMPPATFAPKLVAVACRNLLKCHVAAYDILHNEIRERKGPWKDRPVMVGIAHNMIDFVPFHPWHMLEHLSTKVFRRFYNRSWPDAITGRKQHFGVLGLVPYPAQVPEARGRKTADFIGVNYYTRMYVTSRAYFKAPEATELFAPTNYWLPIGIQLARKGQTVSDLGWSVKPRGLGRMVRFLKRYHLPLFITENGIADAKDEMRPQYLVSHLREIARAVENGADIRGYFHWSLIDNFEWIKGFGPRFGLVEVDYNTFARRPRAAALRYKEIIEAHHGRPPSLECLGQVTDEPKTGFSTLEDSKVSGK